MYRGISRKMAMIQKLQQWRDADHADPITLTRHEVIELLEEIKMREQAHYAMGCNRDLLRRMSAED
jgi:hypothetical protein